MTATPAHDNPLFYWFALRTVPGIGNVRYVQLVRRFGSPHLALEATPTELSKLPDFGASTIDSIKMGVDYKEAQTQIDLFTKSGASAITILDSNYPRHLKEIYDPPPVLLVKGNLSTQDDNAVAIVGSRACTTYGRQIAEIMAKELCKAGLTIISGLARGIDSYAHHAALNAGGRTVAVLGCGLDVIYPPENKELYQEISGSGAVVTEFPFGFKPEKFNFPSRNRIISGLSRGVVVVEAGKASGALSTARHALDQNREVFAVPGNISSASSAGTNELIKQGAMPITSSNDVLLALGYDPNQKTIHSPVSASVITKLPEGQKMVYEALGAQPQQVDLISKAIKKPVAEVLALLFNLELAGLVRQLPGKLFLRQT